MAIDIEKEQVVGQVEQRVVYESGNEMAAYAAHPARFASGIPQVKGVPNTVWINPPSPVVNPS